MLAMIDDRPETPDDMMARAFAPTPDLSTLQARLLHTADLLEAKLRAAGMFDGPDGRDVADLREAATRSAHHDSVVSAWAAHTETMGALGQHLLDAHKPGEVDPEAVAFLDGYHVGGRAVAPSEPGETTLEAALRLLKLAKARGAFAAAEHVMSASAATGPTFRVALVDSADAIPHWVDPDEFKGANFEDGYRACVVVLQDGKVRYHWDGGEAEDNLYLRDWAWVAPALDAAYDAGRSDVLSGAVPPTWDQICAKIKALGLRCYIRGGEGVGEVRHQQCHDGLRRGAFAVGDDLAGRGEDGREAGFGVPLPPARTHHVDGERSVPIDGRQAAGRRRQRRDKRVGGDRRRAALAAVAPRAPERDLADRLVAANPRRMVVGDVVAAAAEGRVVAHRSAS